MNTTTLAIAAAVFAFNSIDEMKTILSEKEMRAHAAECFGVDLPQAKKDTTAKAVWDLHLAHVAANPEAADAKPETAPEVTNAEATAAVTAPQTKGPRQQHGAKHNLRQLFANIGDSHSKAQVFACGTEVGVRTAISDLKNPKYSGGEVMFLQYDKATDSYTRVAGIAPSVPGVVTPVGMNAAQALAAAAAA